MAIYLAPTLLISIFTGTGVGFAIAGIVIGLVILFWWLFQ